MAILTFAIPIVILLLVSIAIYEHVASSTLSLPLPTALTSLTILLPLLAATNLVSLPHLMNTAPHKSSPAFRYVKPVVLQALQGILTTVMATLYSLHLVPSAARDCELSTRWQHMFRTKDAQAIRAIQDALQCCGFRSVKDMAWPFPPADLHCSARFDRALACQGPWTIALQRNAGVNLGVVLLVGVLQVIGTLMATRHAGRNASFSWTDMLQPWTRRSGADGSASRPLLTDNHAQIEEVDEEAGESGRVSGPRYRATGANGDSAPRVQPSGLQSERNAWQDL
ncbi:unnamed protein product [Discula destructiva]